LLNPTLVACIRVLGVALSEDIEQLMQHDPLEKAVPLILQVW